MFFFKQIMIGKKIKSQKSKINCSEYPQISISKMRDGQQAAQEPHAARRRLICCKISVIFG